MATRKPFTSDSLSYPQKTDSELEKRISLLEAKSHTPCQGGSSKLKTEELPPLASKKQSSVHDRISALENRLDALIEQLSK